MCFPEGASVTLKKKIEFIKEESKTVCKKVKERN
jgi:hypothetical protein